METVLKALKCVECLKTLSEPVCLPCGHFICNSHTETDEEKVKCAKCGVSHKNKQFAVAEALVDMIKVQLGSLDFGPQHSETSRACDELKQEIDKNDSIFSDMDYFIHESIDELKNRIVLRSEQLKVKIDEITEELIDDMDEYEKQCKSNTKDFSKSDSFGTLMSQLKKRNQEAKRSWEEWSEVLNELKFDVDKWKQIKAECVETLKDVREKSKQFENGLFMSEFGMKSLQVEYFEKAHIDPVLRKKVSLFLLKFHILNIS